MTSNGAARGGQIPATAGATGEQYARVAATVGNLSTCGFFLAAAIGTTALIALVVYQVFGSEFLSASYGTNSNRMMR